MIATANDQRTQVRLPRDLLKELSEVAKENGRSRNTEILIRLRHSVKSTKRNGSRRG